MYRRGASNVELVFFNWQHILNLQQGKTFTLEMNVDVTNIPNNKKYFNGL